MWISILRMTLTVCKCILSLSYRTLYYLVCSLPVIFRRTVFTLDKLYCVLEAVFSALYRIVKFTIQLIFISHDKPKNHKDSCRKSTKPCHYCHTLFQKNLHRSHEKSCFKNRKACRYCRKSWKVGEYPKDHEDFCPGNTKYCSSCDTWIQVKTHLSHQNSCFKNTKTCRYCHGSWKVGEYPKDHEISCLANKKSCSYCRSWIQIKEHLLHEDSCSKNTRTCQYCRKSWQVHVFPKDHETFCPENTKACSHCKTCVQVTHHSSHEKSCCKNTRTCQYCRKSWQVKKFPVDHKIFCPENKKSCRFCRVSYQANDHAQHEASCVKNTKPCHYCSESVQVQRHLLHEEKCGGQKIIMYHGTTLANATSIKNNGFRPSTDGMLGPGVYASRDIEKARNYGGGEVILKLEVHVGKVKKIDSQGHPSQKIWQGTHDSAWVPPNCGMVNSGRTETCIKDPKRIRLLGTA